MYVSLENWIPFNFVSIFWEEFYNLHINVRERNCRKQVLTLDYAQEYKYSYIFNFICLPLKPQIICNSFYLFVYFANINPIKNC